MGLKAESSILPGGLNSSGEGWQPAGRGGVRGELALSSLARLSVLVYSSALGQMGGLAVGRSWLGRLTSV